VKMMFPLVFCIFPCSFAIIAFPIAVQFAQALQWARASYLKVSPCGALPTRRWCCTVPIPLYRGWRGYTAGVDWVRMKVWFWFRAPPFIRFSCGNRWTWFSLTVAAKNSGTSSRCPRFG